MINGKTHSYTVKFEGVTKAKQLKTQLQREVSKGIFWKPTDTESKTKQETFNYEEIKNQLMEDRIFLSKVGSNVMSNLRFINKLDN